MAFAVAPLLDCASSFENVWRISPRSIRLPQFSPKNLMVNDDEVISSTLTEGQMENSNHSSKETLFHLPISVLLMALWRNYF